MGSEYESPFTSLTTRIDVYAHMLSHELRVEKNTRGSQVNQVNHTKGVVATTTSVRMAEGMVVAMEGTILVDVVVRYQPR